MIVPELRNIEGVELARTGTYRLSTGEQTFTRDHLASAVDASETGAAPRLRIGHIDPRFDGDPAIGSVKNLRLDDDGDLLIGDLVDVPEWLADNLPSIYPGRSIEAKVTEDTMRLTGLALLGVTAPGINALSDLEQLVAAAGAPPASYTFISGADAQGRDISVAVPTGTTVKAAASDGTAEAVSSAWYRASGRDGWVREVRLSPFELVVEDYSMNGERTWRIPFTLADDGTPTFADPIEVVVQYVDRATVTNPVAAAATYTTRAASIAAAGLPPEEDAVDPKALRTQLGLAEDASQEDVDAKLTELNARPTTEQVEAQVAAAAKAPDGVVTVEASALDQLKSDAAAGREARDAQVKAADIAYVAAAAEVGKIPVSRSEHFVALMEIDRDGTRAVLDGLEENIVPVAASGTAVEPEDGISEAEYAAYIQAKTGKEATA